MTTEAKPKNDNGTPPSEKSVWNKPQEITPTIRKAFLKKKAPHDENPREVDERVGRQPKNAQCQRQGSFHLKFDFVYTCATRHIKRLRYS